MSEQITEKESQQLYNKVCRMPKRDLVDWAMREISNAAEWRSKYELEHETYMDLFDQLSKRELQVDELTQDRDRLRESLKYFVGRRDELERENARLRADNDELRSVSTESVNEQIEAQRKSDQWEAAWAESIESCQKQLAEKDDWWRKQYDALEQARAGEAAKEGANDVTG